MTEELYTISQCAEILKTNKNYVYEQIKLGNIPVVYLKSMRVRKSQLEKFMESREVVR